MKFLFENWRKFLKEDASARKAFADELIADNPDWEETAANIDRGDTEAYKKNMKAGRILKKLFHKYADQSFLNSLVLIHWGRYQDIREIIQFGKIDRTDRDELSAVPYLPGSAEAWSGRSGIVIKGRVTLLANSQDELYSGWGREYRKADPQRAKMSGANKGVGRQLRAKEYEEKVFVLDKDDWEPRNSDLQNPEALVDNWKITHIISENDERKDLFEKIAEKSGLDVPVILYDEVSKL